MQTPQFFAESTQLLIDRICLLLELDASETDDFFSDFRTNILELAKTNRYAATFYRFIKSQETKNNLSIMENDDIILFLVSCHYYFTF